MSDDYQKKVYFIPANFALDGKWFGINKRNVLEAAAVFSLCIIPVLLFMPNGQWKLYGAIFCAIPTGVAITGINDLPLSSFFADMIHYRACSMIYATPMKEAILIRERQIIKEKHRITVEREKEREKAEKEQKKLEKKEKKNRKQTSKKTKKSIKSGILG